MDYEALGRYTAAADEAKSLAKELKRALDDLSRSAAIPEPSAGYVSYVADIPHLRNALNLSEQIHARLIEAVNKANHEAGKCGKDPLKIK